MSYRKLYISSSNTPICAVATERQGASHLLGFFNFLSQQKNTDIPDAPSWWARRDSPRYFVSTPKAFRLSGTRCGECRHGTPVRVPACPQLKNIGRYRCFLVGGRGGTRTLKPFGQRILSPPRIPIPPLARAGTGSLYYGSSTFPTLRVNLVSCGLPPYERRHK